MPLLLIIGTGVLVVVVVLCESGGTLLPTSVVVGAFAAYLARIPRLAHVLRQPVVGLHLLGIVWQVFFGEISSRVQAALVSVAFCEVACGNMVFGLLSNRAAVLMGDISYGIYAARICFVGDFHVCVWRQTGGCGQ